MVIPYGVIAVYAGLAIWAGLLISGLKTKQFWPFLIFGMALLLFLNIRYLIEGLPDGIAFFIGIYDVLINIGVDQSVGAGAMMACPDNGCTVWGDTFTQHPAWGVAFHERFLNGPDLRSNLLYGHLICNSVVFVLMHIQLAKPGSSSSWHRLLGRTSFAFLTVGTVCAVWLASEHGPVGEYGGSLSAWGFYSMSFFVYGTAIMGVLAIRKGDAGNHRIWMIRFAGSMWGAFWLFRVMLFVLDPIFREYETVAIQLCIWLSAPLGIIIAEVVRRKLLDNRPAASAAVAAE